MSKIQQFEGVIYLQGEVSFETVTLLRNHLQSSIKPGVHSLDCSGVTKVDSSIASLLLVALALANDAGLSLTFNNLPAAAGKLLKLYDLDGIIHCQ